MTAKNLYEVPLMLEKEGLAIDVCKHLKLKNAEPKNEEWEKMINHFRKIDEKYENTDKKKVNIAIVGKYVKLEDSYLSVVESIKHAAYENGVKANIKFIDCETVTNRNAREKLQGIDGIIVPGGFGGRGIEGKIQTVKYARENNIPFLGICLGMQMAVVEFARDILNIKECKLTRI